MNLLKGVKILDLTRVLAGPFATMILADLGADVVKVELPVNGDDSRSFGPHMNGESGYFMSINRNKKSITLNLKSDEGKKIFMDLVKEFDVVVENFRPGTMEKLGLGYEQLKTLNPEIIYAGISGFGRTGPYSKKPAYDTVIQAMGGLMSITGIEGGEPTRVGASIADITAGLYGCIGILGSLIRKYHTGKGGLIDVAMLDCQVSILENSIARYFACGEIPVQIGNRHPSIAPFGAFKAKDGNIVIAVGNDDLWKKFCLLIDREDLYEDSRFTTNAQRSSNYRDLYRELEKDIRKYSVEKWCALLDEAGIPGGPVQTIDRVVHHPQVISRNMIVNVEHPSAGNTKIPGNPIKGEPADSDSFSPAPVLGQDTADVLRKYMGISEQEIQNMTSRGIL